MRTAKTVTLGVAFTVVVGCTSVETGADGASVAPLEPSASTNGGARNDLTVEGILEQEVKTPAQAETFGGSAGAKLDPCYHQPCDTIDNVSERALRLHALALVRVLTALFAAG